MASGAAAAAVERTSPEQARRAWPRWLAGGVALLVVAVVAVFWEAGGARLLLGVAGVLTAGRGAVLAASGRGRVAGVAALVVGAVAVAVALGPAGAASRVLLVAVPAGLLVGALALLGRGGAVRRSGQAALVWWTLVTGLLATTGLVAGWDRAADGATVVGALGLGLLGVVLLVGSASLRAIATRPAPARPAACAGCACGAGGCGVPR
ncbi:hypothetical protein E4P41_03435 [Geodermatophilus sp. DF01-2]|uniref:hypothetical protein n=1 Tax=Geodermatophilus sp. DF01-2 TaxID=2559610 RepID=UPI0010731070|nr:hypothetical protein [Geodermatophilus sp. DF01_2]TFV63785.1 hypothetical protein E4P41_03435 [Geodermatophilus sp. DF01_2]